MIHLKGSWTENLIKTYVNIEDYKEIDATLFKNAFKEVFVKSDYEKHYDMMIGHTYAKEKVQARIKINKLLILKRQKRMIFHGGMSV